MCVFGYFTGSQALEAPHGIHIYAEINFSYNIYHICLRFCWNTPFIFSLIYDKKRGTGYGIYSLFAPSALKSSSKIGLSLERTGAVRKYLLGCQTEPLLAPSIPTGA